VGWLLAGIVTGAFVWQSARLPSVRANLVSSLVSETPRSGGGRLALGLAQAAWGLMARSLRAVAAASAITGALGVALGLVYIIAGRRVAPWMAARLSITGRNGLYFASATTNCWFATLDDIWDTVQRTTGAWTPGKLQRRCNIT
jgi:hypothetical protein